MIVLNEAQVILLHKTLTKKTGGSAGVRDAGMLDSALHAPFAHSFGVERYPSLIEKCAAIAYFLASDHPFVDGNKRIAILTMLTTLQLNGISLSIPEQALVTFGLDLAQNRLSVEQIAAFIQDHIKHEVTP